MNQKNFWVTIIVVVLVVVVGAIIIKSASHSRNTALGTNPYSSSTTNYIPGTTPPPSGTGQPPSTPPVPPNNTPPPTTFSAPIAYIGCSNTWMYVDGYHSLGGTKFWPDEPSYTGQVITKWNADISNSSGAWRGFDSAKSIQPGAKTLWVLPCAFPTDTLSNVYSSLINVIAEAKRRIPTIQNVYLTGLNSFENCTTAGPQGVANSDAAVAQAIQNGYGFTGPVMAYLSVAETEKNGCHPLVGAPRNKEGQILVNFFGK